MTTLFRPLLYGLFFYVNAPSSDLLNKDTLTHYLPRPEMQSTCNYPFFFWFAYLLIQVIQQPAFTHALVHTN